MRKAVSAFCLVVNLVMLAIVSNALYHAIKMEREMSKTPPMELEQEKLRQRGITVRSLKHEADGVVEYQGFQKGEGWITYGMGFYKPVTLKPGESMTIPMAVNLNTGRMEYRPR